MSDPKDWLYWFRHSSPYINAHRGRTVVLTLSGEALAHGNLINTIHDITLLASLGVRLVVVYGARPQIQERLQAAGRDSHYHAGLRVTAEGDLPGVLEAVGRLRSLLESQLSMGLVNSPMHGARIRVCSGNLVTARPVGVLEGVDLAYTGRVRNVDTAAIQSLLDQGQVVLLPPLGYSPTGDVFNLSYEDVASQVAASLKAEKLIITTERNGVPDADGELLRELNLNQARALMAGGRLAKDDRDVLEAACRACAAGVRRAHIISYVEDGALLQELFTRDGLGTLVSDDDYEHVRAARAEDISGIQELIQPLEEQGVLLRRPRELIETEIDRFVVDERDGTVVGCAALYAYPGEQLGELACFAVSGHYRRSGRGDRILAVIERHARAEGLQGLFVLTTQTDHWFRERGFAPVTPEALPAEKRAHYRQDRKSKVLMKPLGSSVRKPG
ncbi:MAG: amino-acid N-acetyltransferase [Oleiphilaceae bacterium]|nr:amino-acid N-acetyltransferase [Oleiphilaceae bacterium]